MTTKGGPLSGLRILEFASEGPVPLAGMLLADMGADVVRILRPGPGDGVVELEDRLDPMLRGRRVVTADLKSEIGQRAIARLAEKADVLIEGHRPGVMERLNLGPDVLRAVNCGLVYCRVTGWGQDGPLAQTPGHDINFIATNGLLSMIGEAGRRPVPPLNLVADFGGGGLFAIFGILAALHERGQSGQGQVIDVSMLDGSRVLLSQALGFLSAGTWLPGRENNILDGAAPWYRTYETQDMRHIAVGAFEERFWLSFLKGLGVDPATLPDRRERKNWPCISEIIAKTVARRDRLYWENVFSRIEACVSPVLNLEEASKEPHGVARDAFTDVGGATQPAPAPRFARTPTTARPSVQYGTLKEALHDWGA